MSLEGIQKQEKVEETKESQESSEGSIERAKELQAQLEEFNNKDIHGSEELNRAEELAHALSIELQNITVATCLREELPYHPTNIKSV